MKELNNFREFLNESKLDSIDFISNELKGMDKKDALNAIDKLIDHLKTLEHRIITRK